MAAAAEPRTRIADPDCPIGRLNLEWARLCANVRVERRITSWAQTESSLAGVGSLPALDRALDACTGDDSDALLLALLRLHAAGDELGRAGLAAADAAAGGPGRAVAAASLGVEGRLRDRRVPAVGGDRYLPAAASAAACGSEHRADHAAAGAPLRASRGPSRGGRAPDVGTARRSPRRGRGRLTVANERQSEAAALIDAAIAAAVITADDAQLLRRVYLPAADGRPAAPREVAAEMGISWDALRQRCSRSMRALSAAGSAGVLSTAA